MRACPTAAIRVRKGGARMVEDLCIDCDGCLRVCANGAIVPLTHSVQDLRQYEYRIAIPSPTLYGQLQNIRSPGRVLKALERCGFDEAVPESTACDAVTFSIALYLQGYQGPKPVISSFCPTVVRLVQVKYPSLVDHLLQLMPPREIAARDAKRRAAERTGLSEERIGAFYITPCSAKMVAIHDHPGLKRSFLDGAVAIRDLFQALVSALGQVEEDSECAESASGLMWACARVFTRSLPVENTLSVAGLQNVIRILDDMEKGRLDRYVYVECHACAEGCVGGTLTVVNPYVARSQIIEVARSLQASTVHDSSEVRERYEAGHFSTSSSFVAQPPRPMDLDVARAIAKMKERDKVLAKLKGIDCGACGSPTCRAFAEDVVLGEAEEADCVFVREKEVFEIVAKLYSLVKERAETAGVL